MELVASEVMRRSVETVAASLPLPDLERALVRAGVWGFPVLEAGEIVGVVSRSDVVRQLDQERQTATQTSDFYLDAEGFHVIPLATRDDIADRVGERMEHLTVRDVMQPQVIAVAPDQSLRAVAEMMVDHGVHRVLVTREGRLLGVISASDFVRLFAQGRIAAAGR